MSAAKLGLRGCCKTPSRLTGHAEQSGCLLSGERACSFVFPSMQQMSSRFKGWVSVGKLTRNPCHAQRPQAFAAVRKRPQVSRQRCSCFVDRTRDRVSKTSTVNSHGDAAFAGHLPRDRRRFRTFVSLWRQNGQRSQGCGPWRSPSWSLSSLLDPRVLVAFQQCQSANSCRDAAFGCCHPRDCPRFGCRNSQGCGP